MMPSFRYRALTQSGEVVSGSISAPTLAEVAYRIEYLGLVPIDTVEEGAGRARRADFALWSRPRVEDVTVFTRDLALLLKAGARINDALELLAQDMDIGRLRPRSNRAGDRSTSSTQILPRADFINSRPNFRRSLASGSPVVASSFAGGGLVVDFLRGEKL